MSAPAARTRKMETHSPERPLLRAIRFRVCRKAGVRVRVGVRVRLSRRAGAGPLCACARGVRQFTFLYFFPSLFRSLPGGFRCCCGIPLSTDWCPLEPGWVH